MITQCIKKIKGISLGAHFIYSKENMWYNAEYNYSDKTEGRSMFMEPELIDDFFNHYKNSISTITKLERRLLKEAYSFDKWSALLKKKSVSIRSLYIENEQKLKDVIDVFLNPDNYESIDEETAVRFISHVDFLMLEGYRDFRVTIPVLDVLIRFFDENGPKYRLFDAYYFKALAVMEQHSFTEAMELFNTCISMYPDREEPLENYRQYRVICSHYFRLLCLVHTDTDDRFEEYLKSSLNLWVEEPLIDFLTPKKFKGINSIISGICAYGVLQLLNDGRAVSRYAADIVRKEFSMQKDHYSDEFAVDSRIFFVYYRMLLEEGIIDEASYKEKIYRRYRAEYITGAPVFEYGSMDIIALFDDELLDEDFAIEKLFYMNTSYTYINYIVPEMMRITEDEKIRKSLYDDIYGYYAGMPVLNCDYMVDLHIVEHIKKISPYLKDFDYTINLFQNIFVVRQVMTVIHSFMVARMAAVITEHIIDRRPELLIGQLETSSVEEVRDKKQDLINFAKNASRCHDLGKIMCSDIINLQSRRISDEEFSIIKHHPTDGAKIIQEIECLRPYYETTIGHHIFSDGKRGYPSDFDIRQSPVKIFIDIIRICDCIDAATDRLGRNYTAGKSFDTVLHELVESKDVSYRGEVVEVIEEDKELKRKLCALAGEEREFTYYEVYHTYIENEMKFRPKDERFVRLCRLSDLEKIVSFSGRDMEELKELLQKSKRYSYVLADGYGNIYGSVFAVAQGGDNIFIKYIDVSKEYRRKGYGSELIDMIAAVARKDKFKSITIICVTEGHYDKFCWRNGFLESGRPDIMKKKL